MNLTDLDSLADCLVDENAVGSAVQGMADEINAFYGNEPVTALCVLNGGIVITGLLLSKLKMPLTLDYIHATRYGDSLQGSELKWLAEPRSNLQGKNILLIDDIFDQGHTLFSVKQFLLQENSVLSVRAAVLANKIHTRKVVGYIPDFIGLILPDRYVFGMGMDRKGICRNAPGIFALKGE